MRLVADTDPERTNQRAWVERSLPDSRLVNDRIAAFLMRPQLRTDDWSDGLTYVTMDGAPKVTSRATMSPICSRCTNDVEKGVTTAGET